VSLETDLLLDRRRLKRRLFFWRGFAVLAVLAAVLVALRGERVGFEGARVERVVVSGIITQDRKLTDAIDKLADNANIKR
jgi:protease-4